ncbi:MAG: DHA2 family efflux MFS transporter permease subunit [Acidobacteriaceae bacterium]
MSGSTRLSSTRAQLRDRLSSGYEPAPPEFISRLSYYPWLIVGTTCIGAFIGQLDASIVQLALPALEREFHATLTAVSWVAIAYLVALASLLPVFARLSEIFGRKLLYLGGYALFTAASLMCGLVGHLDLLILFRAIQGIGGALLGANSLTILVKAAGPERRGRAMGLFAAAQAVGVSAGPVVGGLLLGTLGWRWVFWASVPFGVAGILVGWFILPQTSSHSAERRFDWIGALLLTPAVVSLVVILSEFRAWGPRSIPLIGTIVAAIVLLPLFAWRERKSPAPLIDLHLFRVPAFTGGMIAVNVSYALLYSMFFLMSFAFIRGFGDSPISAGLRLAIIPIALGLVAPISGALYERIGARVITTVGMALSLGAMVLLSQTLTGAIGGGTPRMSALAIFGIGLGLFIAPNNSATIAAAPEERSGEAGGMLNLMRVLGCIVGVATASTTLSWRLEVLTGVGEHTVGVPTQTVLSATNDVLWLLGAFAVVSAGTALLRSHLRPAPATEAAR